MTHGIKGLSENQKPVPDQHWHIRTKKAFYGANECSKLFFLLLVCFPKTLSFQALIGGVARNGKLANSGEDPK